MKNATVLTLLLAGCATVAPESLEYRTRGVYEGYTVDQVRRATVEAVNDVARFIDAARVTEDGRVVSDYTACGWTHFEVRFTELPGAVAADVEIESRPRVTCSARRPGGRGSAPYPYAVTIPDENGRNEYGRRTTVGTTRIDFDGGCTVEVTEWRGKREGEILDEIRARLTPAPSLVDLGD